MNQSAHPAPEADVPTTSPVKLAGLIGGIVSSLLVLLFVELDTPEMTRMAAVAVLMSVWWITEAIPLGATALVPLVLFPFFGIMSGADTSRQYGHHIVFLFIGGFLIALAMERWNVHRRIALNILAISGSKPVAVLAGFMIGTAFLSMWISNTATAMMMVPIAMALLTKWDEANDGSPQRLFASSLMMGIAYAASIGGITTLVGTPPNIALEGIYSSTFPEKPGLSFGQWMLFAAPITVVMLLVTWSVLAFRMRKETTLSQSLDNQTIRNELQSLGSVSREEWIILIVFVSLAFAWIFRKPLDFGFLRLPGWSQLMPNPGFLNDGTVAIAMALLLFMIPSRKGKILDVTAFPKLPWGIVLLFGGGFALAAGFKETELSTWVGSQLAGFGELPLPILILIIALTVTFLTEVTSNTASAQILLPILAALAVELDVEPLLLMVPGVISCSCAFMLPVATPPNAIVFGSGRIRMSEMVKTGIILNIVGVIITTLATITWSWVLYR